MFLQVFYSVCIYIYSIWLGKFGVTGNISVLVRRCRSLTNQTSTTYQLGSSWSAPVQQMLHSSAQRGLQSCLRVTWLLISPHSLMHLSCFLHWYMRCIWVIQKPWPIHLTLPRKSWWAWRMGSWSLRCWALKMPFWQWSNFMWMDKQKQGCSFTWYICTGCTWYTSFFLFENLCFYSNLSEFWMCYCSNVIFAVVFVLYGGV